MVLFFVYTPVALGVHYRVLWNCFGIFVSPVEHRYNGLIDIRFSVLADGVIALR